MNITLYKAQEASRLESHVNEDGEIDIEAFESSQIVLADKQRAYVAVIKNRAAGLGMLDAAIKDLQAQKERLETQQARLKDALQTSMALSGITEILAIDGTFKAKLFIGRDTSVELDADAVFPSSLCNEPKPPSPSKTKIKAAIESGEAIAGARIVTKDRLEIK
jgi:hypothetical protein